MILSSVLLGLASLTIHSNSITAVDPSLLIVPFEYPTIQDALDAADPGDTLYITKGTYNEHVTVDTPNITFIGEGKESTVVNGSGGDTFLLKAENISIKGFTLTRGFSGVQTSPWTSGHEISDCIITDNDFGIRGHYDVHNVTISNNIISSNKFVGIEMCFHNSLIKDNNISKNGKGEFMEASAGIEIVEGVYYATISSNNNTITGNTIEGNFNGILPVRYSEGNLFYHNTFQNNTNQVLMSNPSLMFSNRVEENYWSDYEGQDSNGDGFGDTPYILDVLNRDPRPLTCPYFYWSNPIIGDINKDMKVDIRDVAIAAQAFGAYRDHPRWKQNADTNKDNIVDIRDIALIAKNFGEFISSS